VSMMVQAGSKCRRRRNAAISQVEALTTAFTLALLLVGALAVTSSVARGTDRYQRDVQMVGDARVGLDEVLYQIRSASMVMPSQQTLAGSSYIPTADGRVVVLSAPGYNPASDTVLLPGVTDYIAFYTESGKLKETVVPGLGSARVARTQKTLVKNVDSFQCTFKARDYATGSAVGTNTFALKSRPVSGNTPVVYINGVQTSATYSSSGSYGSVTVSNLALGADVQIVYTVDPTQFATDTASILSDSDKPALEVSVQVRLRDVDNRLNARIVNLDGAARLRNRRG